MSSKASQDRFVVMEAYVNIMKGNIKALETVQTKLIEVLSIVICLFTWFRDQNTLPRY